MQLPHQAVYFKKVLKWDAFGKKSFDVYPYDVLVVEETEKSYKIKFKTGNTFEGRQTFVRKDSVKFNFLTSGNYCEKKEKYMPILACSICYKDCALRGRDFPKAVIINT